MSIKTFVLDTSVLISAPRAFLAFAEHRVIIPLVVIKELEGQRHDPEIGHSARAALRGIEAIRLKAKQSGGNLREGFVINDEGGTLRIEINHVDQSGLPQALRDDRTHDTRIIAVAFNHQAEQKARGENGDVVVVSKDLPLRLLAEVAGVSGEEYRNEQVITDDAYTGLVEVEVPDHVIDSLYSGDEVTMSDLGLDAESVPSHTGLHMIGATKSTLARVNVHKQATVVPNNLKAFGVEPRSKEQKIALAHMLDSDIGITSLRGVAGTGKSYLALAAGLEAVMEKRTHDRIVVFRPLFAVGGQDLGYLPGDQGEKMGPWAAAVYDALENMVGKEVREEIEDRRVIEVLPLTHIRGRTLSKTFTIIDEAQNLELPVLLTALSRMGETSKVVLSWDDAQRDNLRVGRHDGIAAVVERFKDEPLFAHTTFVKPERGPIAAMVTKMLDAMVL